MTTYINGKKVLSEPYIDGDINTTKVKIPAQDIERTIDGDFNNWNGSISPDDFSINRAGGSGSVADYMVRSTDSYAGTYALELITVDDLGGGTILSPIVVSNTAGVVDGQTIQGRVRHKAQTGTTETGVMYQYTGDDTNDYAYNFTGVNAGTWTQLMGAPTLDQIEFISNTASYQQSTFTQATLPASGVDSGYAVITIKSSSAADSATIDNYEVLVDGADQVTNGTFEAWSLDVDQEDPLTDWSSVEIDGNNTVVRSTDHEAGTYSFEIDVPSGVEGQGARWILYQEYSGSNGTSLNAKVYTKDDSNAGTYLSEWTFVNDNANYTQIWDFNTMDWVNVSSTPIDEVRNETGDKVEALSDTGSFIGTTKTVTIPASGKIVMCLISGDGDNGTNKYWFDDAKLVEVGGIPSNTIPLYKVKNESTLSELENKDSIFEVEAGGDSAYKISGTGVVSSEVGLGNKITEVDSATYDLLITDNILHVTYTTTAAVTSLTLPTAQTIASRKIVIKDAGGNANTNNITIDTEGSETIDGENTLVINGDYDTAILYSDGSNWFVM